MAAHQMNNNRYDDEPPSGGGHDGGSFWTSYSDLLLGLSIIFLVLFFFTFLRSGVDQAKTAAQRRETEQFLKGKVPESVAARTREQEDTVKRTLEEIAKRKQVLDETAKDMERLMVALDVQSQTVDTILKEKQEQAAVLRTVADQNEQLEEKAARAEEASVELKAEAVQKEQALAQLNEQVTNLSQTKEGMTAEIARLNEEIIRRSEQLSAREAEVTAEQRRAEDLKTAVSEAERNRIELEKALAAQKLESENLLRDYEHRLSSEAEAKIAAAKERDSLEAQLSKLQADNRRLALDLSTGESTSAALKREIADLQKDNARLQAMATGRDSQLADLKAAADGLRQENGALRGEVDKLSRDLAGAQRESERLKGRSAGNEQELAALRAENRRLGGEAATLDAKLSGLSRDNHSLKGENTALRAQVTRCDEATAKARSLGDELRVARAEIKTLGTQRRDIASSIQRGLAAKGVDAQVNATTGTLTLAMDASFRFRNGSAELTPEAKRKLKEIMPVYASKIFENPSAFSNLSAFTITGHASPRWNKEYVDPKDRESEAFRRNQNLSEARARSISEYIFSDEIGYYAFKTRLRSVASVAGKGHEKPVRLRDNETSDEICGQYDCAKSRRVELGFTLKGERQ